MNLEKKEIVFLIKQNYLNELKHSFTVLLQKI